MNRINYLIFTLLCSMLTVGAQTPNSWSSIPNFGGVHRSSCIAFAIDSFGYVGGGYFHQLDSMPYQQYPTDLWQYNPYTSNWIQRANFPGIPRASAICFTIGLKAYVGLGFTGTPSTYLKDFWEYDPATNAWTQKADFAGGGRTNATGFSLGNVGYVGLGQSDTAYTTRDFWRYDPTADSWTRVADFGGLSRADAICFSNASAAYVGLGITDSVGFNYARDMWEYNQAADTWLPMSGFPDSARITSFNFTIGDKGYMGTGVDANQNFYSDFWEYNFQADQWSKKDSFGGGFRSSAVGFSIGTNGYAGLGEYPTDHYFTDFWMYTPDSLPTGICPIDASTITLSPNPTSDKLYINTSLADYTISITDMTGRSWPAAFTDREIDVSALPAGIYCLRLQNSDGMVVRKFVKE